MNQFILFDLDGTLSDPKIGITTCVQYALLDAGIKEENLDLLEPFIGPPLKDSFMQFYGMNGETADRAVEKYRERFSTKGLYENSIYPGMQEMLKHLQERGFHLAVASSKPTVFVEKILEYFQIAEYFEAIVGSELDGKRVSKVEVIEEAMNRLGVKTQTQKKHCIMVGDRKYDIEGARGAGIKAVAVEYGYAQKTELLGAGPDVIVGTVKELEDLLMAMWQPSFLEALSARTTETVYPQGTSSFIRAVRIISPILVYFILNNLIIFLETWAVSAAAGTRLVGSVVCRLLTEHSLAVSTVMKLTAMSVAALVLVSPFLKEYPVFRPAGEIRTKLLFVVMLGICSALAVNGIFSLLQFTQSSDVYTEVAREQFRLPLVWGLLFYAVAAPVAEEIVFRGLVFNRLRRQFPVSLSILLSAALFGIFHGNTVQGVYGFLLGLLLAWVYEKCGTFLAPVLLHASANAAVYLVMHFTLLKTEMTNPGMILCLSFLAVFSVFMIAIRRRKHKRGYLQMK